MKKCNKFIVHIYKELDNELSVRDKEKLKKHIASCENCKKEYDFINALITELKDNNKDVKVPENFNLILRQKLAEVNLNKKEKVRFYKKISVNYAVTVCAAIGIIVFAFSYDFNHIKNGDFNEPTIIEPQNSKENIENSTALKTNPPVSAPTIKPTQKSTASTKPTETKNPATQTTTATNEEQPKAPQTADKSIDDGIINEDNTAAAQNKTEEAAPNEIKMKGFNEKDENLSKNGGAGGGSPSSSMGIRAAQAVDEYVTVIVNSKTDIIDKIEAIEKIDEASYKVSIKEYDKIIGLLKDLDFEIQGNSEENMKKDYFIIKIN